MFGCIIKKVLEQKLQNIINESLGITEGLELEVFRIISFKPDFHYKRHRHKRIELNYILSGSCVMMFGKQLVKLNKNNSILIFPGKEHDFFVDSKQGIKIVQLEFELPGSVVEDMHEDLVSELSFLYNLKDASQSYLKIPNNPEIGNCMERIIREYRLRRNNFNLLYKLYFIELILLLSRVVNRQKRLSDHSAGQYLQIAMNRIHQEYSAGVSIKDLARECRVSERYLRKLFHEHLESTPVEYCNNVRINKSLELLADRTLPIKEIAYRVGYATPQYFSRMFKQKYGFTPQSYRKILFDSDN